MSLLQLFFSRNVFANVRPTAFYNTLVEKRVDVGAALVKSIGADNIAGQRFWPNAAKDKELGVRIDWGMKYKEKTSGKWYRNLDIQLNADANDAKIRNAVAELQRGTHTKIITVIILLGEGGETLHPGLPLDKVMDEVIRQVEEL